MQYNRGTRKGTRLAGKSIDGYRPSQLCVPTNVIFDRRSKSFIISDYHNRRVLRLPPGKSKCVQTIIDNVECYGLAIDDEGALYVSDTRLHEVRRYRAGSHYGTVVAGGNGQGSHLDQLNHPTYIFVGQDQTVYVSDSWNDRVMQWKKNAEKGHIMAGGKGKGNDRTQLNYPTGLFVDRFEAVYVADYWNHRVMRWYKDAPQGSVIAGGYGSGDYANQLNCPEGLAFDRNGNLYVADSNNHRIQRFNIQNIRYC
ncbi:unnamed protein product [Rotaria sp. Silwood2]|nr:unnamed protein product [Rotaria sp. Silwood2]CAF3014219.1 unnamed protein product [Rotaria sp. Silwood2]CAF3193923.1 unnamed protein product [Rotaria sp. Silwood2]CAF3334591.1 unnamed protein product [Rotaria sp. Silwood2]CAF3992499.1 unnamed protein product [Rotaria sp. Silwood2]